MAPPTWAMVKPKRRDRLVEDGKGERLPRPCPSSPASVSAQPRYSSFVLSWQCPEDGSLHSDQAALEDVSDTTVQKRPTAVRPDPNEPRRYVDLERREDRFIIYVRDTRELSEALDTHTRQLSFPNTPVTRTVYFGDVARGLPPGLSIKARSYERERLPGRWDLAPDSRFELLEIKRTVKVESDPAPSKGKRRARSTKSKQQKTADTMVEILKLSGSILGRSTYKSKQRKPHTTLTDLMRVISDPKSARKTIDKELYVHLLETVGPFEDFNWLPVIGTEYERTHFVTRDEQYRDVFRATLDKRVTHYAFDENSGGYVGVPVGTEDFSRFEVKLDEAGLARTALGDWLDEMVVAFRAFRIPSKKYRGMTLRSVYQIRREGLRNELPGFRVYTEFASRPVRYRDHEHYVNLARYIQSSKAFRLYHDVPHLLEEHEHYVEGSYKGLSISISGSQLDYWRDRELIAENPIAIFREDARPVTSVPLTSRHDLDEATGIAKMKDRESHYIRSRGFLVENRRSGRVYEVGLERRIRGGAPAAYFAVVEYVGRARGRPRFDEAPIIKDLTLLHRFLHRDPLLKPA